MTRPQFGILVCWNQKGSRVCLTQLSTLWGRNLDSGPDRQTQRLYSELEDIWWQDLQGEAITWATVGSLTPGESQCELCQAVTLGDAPVC